MSEFEFVQATKEQSKARIALAGPSGSGKTWTALVLATGLAQGKPVAVIDAERGSASKYVGPFQFNRLNLYTYDPRDLVKALASAAKSGHESVVIDSLSRFWGGHGGMLEIVDNVSKRNYGGNTFGGGWKEARPIENDMIEAMLGYPGHVIATLRVKTAYEITKVDGKSVPVKLGLQPEQRNGIEYEFDVFGDMDQENNLIISKSRCSDLSGKVINRPGPEVAATLLEWLSDGTSGHAPNDYRDIAVSPATGREELRELYRAVKADGKLGAVVMDEHGRMVTLHDLITRKGSEFAAAALAGPPPKAGGDDPEAAFVTDVLGRLADVASHNHIDALAEEVSKALAAGLIGAGVASELLQSVADKARVISGAAA